MILAYRLWSFCCVNDALGATIALVAKKGSDLESKTMRVYMWPSWSEIDHDLNLLRRLFPVVSLYFADKSLFNSTQETSDRVKKRKKRKKGSDTPPTHCVVS